MKTNKVKKLLKNLTPSLWLLAIIFLGSLFFSLIGITFGSPLHDWLSLQMSDDIAIMYFMAFPIILTCMYIFKNPLIAYSGIIIFLWLGPFWKVAASFAPRMSTGIGIIVVIIFIISNFNNDKESA